MLYAGETIGGQYKIIQEIGRGGMSIVYQAEDLRLGTGKLWAIKEFTYSGSATEKAERLASLRKEAELMKMFDHPRLPRIVNIIEQDETLYLVMDFIEGVSLDKVVEGLGALPQDAVINWGKQLCEALYYLHSQKPPIIYLDMKPSNIMLKTDDTIRLIDFGISASSGKTEEIFGTPGYAAPEQTSESAQLDARTDIYSLGVTLHHLLTGKNPLDPPLSVEPIRRYNPQLSRALEWVIMKCTQLDPGNRFNSCAEIYYALDNLEKFDVDYVRKLKNKRNLFIASAALTVVFAIVGTTGLALRKQDAVTQFNEYVNGSMYEEAIDIMNEYSAVGEIQQPEMYVKLLNSIESEIQTTMDDDIKEEIAQYFSASTLTSLKADNENLYIQVNYLLGRLYWNYYEDDATGMQMAGGYFESALAAVAEIEENGGNIDLNNTQIALMKNYYLVSYIYTFRPSNDDRDDGDTSSNNSEDRTVALGYLGISNADRAGVNTECWKAMENIVEIVAENMDTGMGVKARVTVLSRVWHTLYDKASEFAAIGYDDGGSPDAQALYENIYSAMKALEEELENTGDTLDKEAYDDAETILTSAIEDMESSARKAVIEAAFDVSL